VRPAVVVLAIAGLAAAIWGGLQWHAQRHATLTFLAGADAMPQLEVAFFPDRLAFAQPSPPPPFGELQVDAGELTVGAELVPSTALVRYRGAGVGAGFTHVKLGEPSRPVVLRAPSTLRGRVGEPVAIWSFGWRCAGLEPIAGAEVWLMGGGEHGVDLARAVTDAEGRFTIEGVDGDLDGLGLRVRAAGFALHHESIGRFGPTATEPTVPVLALARGASFTGVVEAPPAVDRTQLRVLARGLPGVDARVAADGTFSLGHVPIGLQPRLLLSGLGPTWSYSSARAGLPGPLRIEIVPGAAVRGRVRETATGRALSGALVWCGDGEVVRSDESGHFELRQLQPGEVELSAQHQTIDGRRRRIDWIGHRRTTLTAGQLLEDFDLFVNLR
jgi:hypothetical protein